jgi:hypothetical protein
MTVIALTNHPAVALVPARYSANVEEALAATYENVGGRLRRVMPNGMKACPMGAILCGSLLQRQHEQGRPLTLEPEESQIVEVLIALQEEELCRTLTVCENDANALNVADFRRYADYSWYAEEAA